LKAENEHGLEEAFVLSSPPPWDARLSLLTFTIAFCAIILSAGSTAIEACTLWAATGERAAYGGSLIAKNRDWTPEADEVRLVDSDNGLRFLGLFPVRDRGKPSPVAGINEKGLVVVTASASSVPREKRIKGGKGLLKKLLTDFSTVEAILAKKMLFSRTHSAMYLVADPHRIAWIEVAPQGRFAIWMIESGVLEHTNHYLDETLLGENAKVGRSSRSRLARINKLLSVKQGPLSLEDFITFSGDRNDGPDNSLWRTGSKPEGERTLASWIVSIPRESPPELFVRLANPGESEKTVRIELDGPFWKMQGEKVF
jgi:hypothetical protein